MSAGRDQSPKFKLVAVNGKSVNLSKSDGQPASSVVSSARSVASVLSSYAANYPSKSSRVLKAEALKTQPPHEAIEGLRQNLNALNQLHSRLRFMLQELEELIQDE